MYGVSQDFYHSNILDAIGWFVIAATIVSSGLRFLKHYKKSSQCVCMIYKKERQPQMNIENILTFAYCILLTILLSAGNVFEQSEAGRPFLRGNGEALLIGGICILLINRIIATFIPYNQFWKKILYLASGILATSIAGILLELDFTLAGATWIFFAGLSFYAYWTYPRRHEEI